MANYLDTDGLSTYTEQLTEKYKTIFASKTDVGTPLTANTAADMTDTSKIYVYTGSETGYTAGNWYYYNGSAWVSGGVYNSSAFVTDTSLTIPDMAADAKATGDKIAGLENSIINNEVIIGNVVDGYINKDTGELESSETWSASDYLDVSNYYELVGTMTPVRSVYNAFYRADKSFLRAFFIETTETHIVVPNEAVYMRLSGRTDALLATKLYYISKNTKTVNTINNDKQARIPVFVPNTNIASTEKNGVTYSFTNGKGTFSGTPSSTFTINIDGSTTSIPQWLNAGETYYVTVDKTGSDKVYFNIQTYDNNGSWYSEPLKIARGSGAFCIDSFSGIKGVLIRYSVSSAGGGNVDGTTIKISIYQAPKKEKHIRIMQNNIGKFRYGYSGSSSLETYGLTEEQYQIKLANYKRMYGEYRPDILCVQEMVQYMDKAQTHDSFKVLYNDIFYNNSFGGTAISYGIFAQIDGPKFSQETITGTVGGVSYSVVAEICEAIIDNSVVAIVSTALNSESGYETTRAAQLQLIMNRISGYNYAIIGGDLNVYSDSELTSLVGIAEAAGYTAANYDFWGRQDTYVPHPGHTYYNKIDNILVRGNIKITNFEVLTNYTPTNPTDYYTDNLLASDHIPIVADLVIF